jgi:glycosyltransferase involved in cell wall biosynthesis
MKAILVDGVQIGGAERRALSIFAALRADGHPVKLLVSSRFRDIAVDGFGLSPEDVTVYNAYPWLLRRIARVALRLRSGAPSLHALGWRLEQSLMPWRDRHVASVLAAEEVDCVHVFLDPTVGKRLPVRTIIEVTGPDYVERLEKTGMFGSTTAVFHAVNETVHELTQSHVPGRPVLQAPITFFDLSRFPPPLPSEQRRNVIVFAHRFLPRKNGLLFARVAARFLDETDDWTVQVLGRGTEEQAIRTTLDRHIATGRAFVGYKSPIFEDLSTAKVFASVIHPNNYPSQSVLEALAYGNALLLSDTGTSLKRFLAGNGVSCSLDEDDMLAALRRLTADQAALQTMGQKSRHLVETTYGKQRYIDHLYKIYS